MATAAKFVQPIPIFLADFVPLGCHGNGQNAKKLKNTKMITAGYSPNRN
jgi:hypothetical protein